MKHKKIMILALALLLLTVLCCTSALAAGGDVAGAVEQTWTEAAKQIKSVLYCKNRMIFLRNIQI